MILHTDSKQKPKPEAEETKDETIYVPPTEPSNSEESTPTGEEGFDIKDLKEEEKAKLEEFMERTRRDTDEKIKQLVEEAEKIEAEAKKADAELEKQLNEEKERLEKEKKERGSKSKQEKTDKDSNDDSKEDSAS